MAHNTFGKHFSITSFGESHGKHIGVIIDGCPSNVSLDLELVRQDLQRRRPGQSTLTTSRKENESFEITTGLFEGKTTGSPICILIANTDSRSKDYEELKDVYRPSHADFTYDKKYGIRDYKGGGRSSARITAGWVAAGAIAKQLLNDYFAISIQAYVQQVYTIICPKSTDYTYEMIEASTVRCPDKETSARMVNAIESAKEEGDSLGGVITCTIKNTPIGIGDPVFNKLNAQLANGMMAINAVKGFQLGSGFDSILKKGSELNDEWYMDNDEAKTATNNSGGIQGGISNGMDINFDVAFKPTSTIAKSQKSVTNTGESVDLKAKGRHDPCVLPRAVPIVEAMAALVLIDNLVHSIPQP